METQVTDFEEYIWPDLADIVGEKGLLTDAAALAQYGCDWTRIREPRPAAVVLPRSIGQVQAIVQLARRRGIALVPSGGRTGLSGGAVAASGELVVALDKLNWIEDFDPVDRSVRCGAGVVTERLQGYAAEQGLFYPVDFASTGSSQIGGNISTNAGGIKVIRYGMTRDWVAGLKLVTGTGELLDLNRGLIKNNAGYDLRHLVIGAEGTLGIVVEATLRLTRPPADPLVLVLGAPDMGAIMKILERFQRAVELSAFEFFSESALEKVTVQQGLSRPFDTRSNFYALIELEGGTAGIDETAMALFEECVQAGWVEDGTMSQSLAQAQNLWRLREDISETIARWTPYKNDLSSTVSRAPRFLADVDAVVAREYPDFEILWYGHIGDGNLHLNVLKPDELALEEFQTRCARVSEKIFEVVRRHGGSISAEHGVGLLKKDYLAYSRAPEEIAIMRGIKAVFDPDNIMNPGKIFDAD